jgi:phage baseplate assembly protein W
MGKTVKKTIIYSDVNSHNPTKYHEVHNIDAIRQSIENILTIVKGTVHFARNFGASIQPILFEPMDDATELLIFQRVVEAIEQWEPRVRVDYAATRIIANFDHHQYDVEIAYYIIGFEQLQYVEGFFEQKSKQGYLE